MTPPSGAVILTGDEAGGAFSAGANIKDSEDAHHQGFMDRRCDRGLPKRRRFQAMNLLSDFAKPLVAAVNGYADRDRLHRHLLLRFDRGFRACRVAARRRSRSACLPAQGGTVRLARWVGRGQAMKLALGFPLKAEEAHRAGLAQWVVPHDELMGKAMEVAEHLAQLPPLAARLAKEAVAFGLDGTLREAANADLYRFMALELTEDKKEAHQAWRERRKPVLKGR
jgi:enoyl-CoA hydratase/carnithine racemase